MSGEFPSLLSKTPRLLGSLTRYDLSILGVSYLVLSFVKVSGLYALGVNVFVLIFLKLVKKKN